MRDILLAKSSGETLATHIAYCLKAGRALLLSLPLSQEEKQRLESDVLLAIAFHDVGKAASGFQRVLYGEQKDWGGKRHEILSAAFASSLLDISPATLLAVLTHHKDLPADGITTPGVGCLPSEQIPWGDDLTPIWKEMAEEWQENQALFHSDWEKICEALGRDDLAVLSPNLAILALDHTWLNRTIGKSGQRKAIPFDQRYYASLVRGLTIASDHLGSAHHIPTTIPDFKSFCVLRQDPRPFQKEAGQGEGSAILRAPTGSGKTEAALLWAQRNQRPNGRLFYVLPYMASINAMYLRLGSGISQSQPGIFGANNVGLLHSRAVMALYDMLGTTGDDCSRLDHQENAKVLSGLARAIWFSIRVCTPQQILRVMLRGKGWETMLAEFPNACFVFDEVHAYDPRMVGLTLGAAKLVSQWGARSLFLSATLPDFLSSLITEVLGEVPIISPNEVKEGDKEILDRKRHTLTIRNGTLLTNLNEIVRAVKSCKSTLIVCNHVRTAQELFDILQGSLGGGVVVLHSRFNQQDRNLIERELVGCSLPKVLIATQVVEVSLDVDFDQAFLEPAPIDALVQRMGRVNRAGKREPAPIVIFTEQVNRHHLYCNCRDGSHDADCRVYRSIEELQLLPNPISEGDLVTVANRVYINGYQGDDRLAFEEGLNHPDIINFEERLLAGAHQDWVNAIIEKADGVVEILPKCLLEEYKKRKEDGLWIEANSLLVPIQARSLAWLESKIDMSQDPWIANLSYSPKVGLKYDDIN